MNFGVCSSTAMDVTTPTEFPYTSTKMFNDSIHSNPDVVIMQFGTNDAKRWNWDEGGDDLKFESLYQFLHFCFHFSFLDYFILSYLRLVHTYRSLPSNPRF